MLKTVCKSLPLPGLDTHLIQNTTSRGLCKKFLLRRHSGRCTNEHRHKRSPECKLRGVVCADAGGNTHFTAHQNHIFTILWR